MAECAKPLILIVDDSFEGILILKSWLLEAGYAVQGAGDGLEALGKATMRMPDLVICDVILPSMLGWELCQRLKEMASPRHLPVIMLTGRSTASDEMRSYESLADDHFTKPADRHKLLAAVARHLPARSSP